MIGWEFFIFTQSKTLPLLMGMRQSGICRWDMRWELQRDRRSMRVLTRGGEGYGGAETWSWRKIWRGGGVIRWMRTNSAILHLESSSRRQEMSVDSSPFMRLVPFLYRTFLPEQKQTEEGVIQSDQTSGTPSTMGEKVTWNRRLHGDHRPERNASMNWFTQAPRDRRRWREKWVF